MPKITINQSPLVPNILRVVRKSDPLVFVLMLVAFAPNKHICLLSNQFSEGSALNRISTHVVHAQWVLLFIVRNKNLPFFLADGVDLD